MAGIAQLVADRRAQLEAMQEHDPDQLVREISLLRGQLALVVRDSASYEAPLDTKRLEEPLGEMSETQSSTLKVLTRSSFNTAESFKRLNKELQKGFQQVVTALHATSGGSGSSWFDGDFGSDGKSKGKARGKARGRFRTARGSRGVIGSIRNFGGAATSRIAQFGGAAASRLAQFGGAVKGALGLSSAAAPALAAAPAVASPGVIGSIRAAGSSALSTGSKVLASGGRLLSRVAAPLAAAGTVMDVSDAQKRAEAEGKNRTGAGMSTALVSAGTFGLGGLLGINSTGDLASTIGNVVTLGLAPELSKTMGRAVDGAFDGIGTGIESIMDFTGAGDVVGAAVATVLSPFSEEARDSLSATWNNRILPSMSDKLTGFSDTMTSTADSLTKTVGVFSDAAGKIGDSILGGASKVKDSVIGAVSNVYKAASTGDFSGAAKAAVAGAKDVVNSTGTAIGSVGKATYDGLGSISARFESGGRGVATISTGKGDRGGVSYGTHQLASNTGSMQKFLDSKEADPYRAAFAGLKPGSAEFNAAYKNVVGSDEKGFAAAQKDYITRTHYQPAAQKLARDTGIDVDKRGAAVEEMVYSTGVQFGSGSTVMTKALKSAGLDNNATDEQIVEAVQNYKRDNAATLFKSSSAAVQASAAKRAENEKAQLLALAKTGGQSSASSATAATASKAAQKPVEKPAPGKELPPEKVQVVATPAQPEQKPSTQIVQAPGLSGPSVAAGLDDIPVFFPALHLVPVMTGRV